jgi:membrane associated rhomboid family serine protease
MARPRRVQDRLTFGGSIPWAVGLLLSLVAGLSLLVAFGDRHAGSLFMRTALTPSEVWHGQVWRLVTWPFIELGPLSLILTCVMIYWFGRDLAEEWGSRRFVAVFGAVVLGAAVATCLIARIDRDVMEHTYLGGWALSTAMIVAWGLWFPTRVVRIYFVLPVTGFWIAWLTIGITLAFAAYSGWESVLPELGAESAILTWLFRRSLAARVRKVRTKVIAAQHEVERARRGAQTRASLRAVERYDVEDDDVPSPEIDAEVRKLFERAKAKRGG